jgi:pilus assembly protein Flp/PilA
MRMLARCEHGATAVEYALICALIVITMVAGLQTLAGGSSSMWGRILENVTSVM